MLLKSCNTEPVQPTVLRIINHSGDRAFVLWLNYEGCEVEYACLDEEDEFSQSTYSSHPWRFRTERGRTLGEYAGPSAEITLQPDILLIGAWTPAKERVHKHPEWGTYRRRGEAFGIPIKAYDVVCSEAVQLAEHILSQMLARAPLAVRQQLVDNQCSIAIIGRNQTTCDIPEHRFMRRSAGRDIDLTTRGLGGTMAVPTTSCGEENLLMLDDRFYPCENILIHEFGHAVMNCGLSEERRADIERLYECARAAEQYPADCYMMENPDEYWAEGCQSWFDATVREDVNGGVSTREKVLQHDPGLAAMLQYAFGDNPWRYPQDSPGVLRQRGSRPVTTTEALADAAAAPNDLVPDQILHPPLRGCTPWLWLTGSCGRGPVVEGSALRVPAPLPAREALLAPGDQAGEGAPRPMGIERSLDGWARTGAGCVSWGWHRARGLGGSLGMGQCMPRLGSCGLRMRSGMVTKAL